MSLIEAHDPGGKTELAMLPGMRGDAEFSEDGRFRYWLDRSWYDLCRGWGAAPYLLSIGMNPSTARADVDDPTIRRDIALAKREGFSRLVKVNIMDLRATSPKRLLAETPCSDRNRPNIVRWAEGAGKIVVCYGKIHKKLRRYADAAMVDLRGRPLWCLGKNDDGSPKHPLYLAGDTPLIPYP